MNALSELPLSATPAENYQLALHRLLASRVNSVQALMTNEQRLAFELGRCYQIVLWDGPERVGNRTRDFDRTATKLEQAFAARAAEELANRSEVRA